MRDHACNKTNFQREHVINHTVMYNKEKEVEVISIKKIMVLGVYEYKRDD